MKLYSRILELLIISILLFVAAGCPKNESLKAQQIVLPTEVGKLYDELGFEYAGLQEAEKELLALRDSTGNFPRNEFISLLSYDPATLDYDFKTLRDIAGVNIVDSHNGNMKLYFWRTPDGESWENVIQYKEKGTPYIYRGSILDFSGLTDAPAGCAIRKLNHVVLPDGTRCYIISTRYRSGDSHECSMLVPVKIANGRLEAVELFDPEFVSKEGHNSTWRCYDKASWQKRTQGDGEDWIYSYNTATKTLYVPEVVDLEVTGRYNLYNFENGKFVYAGSEGGYWLYPTIRDFKYLEVLFPTRQFMVRIDRLDDDSYRYASWSDELTMRGQPDIILYNGHYDADSNTYTFVNGSFEYRVTPGAPEDELTVFQNGEKILSETRIVR